jgi:DNA-binding transcriptional regulator WhiA
MQSTPDFPYGAVHTITVLVTAFCEGVNFLRGFLHDPKPVNYHLSFVCHDHTARAGNAI